MSEPVSCRLRWRGQTSGPFPLETILRRLDDNELGLWHEIEYGDTWLTLEEFLARTETERRRQSVPGTARPRIVVSAPQAGPHDVSTAPDLPAAISSVPLPPPAPPRIRPKQLKLFVAAGFLLGFTGAHNFYAGFRGTAIVQLLLTGVLFWLGFGLFVTWSWALIELLVVHSDQRGVPMV